MSIAAITASQRLPHASTLDDGDFDGAALANLDHSQTRLLLASTPPPTATLRPSVSEDRTARTLHKDKFLTLPRFDLPGSARLRSGDLGDLHTGAIRLFDRGILALATAEQVNDVLGSPGIFGEATWTWAYPHGESDGLRLIADRHTFGYLPYHLGQRGLTPATMSAPELGAVIAWHLRDTETIRLDLDHTGLRAALTLHRASGEKVTSLLASPTLNEEDLVEVWQQTAAHFDPRTERGDRLGPALMSAFCQHLAARAVDMFGEQRVTLDLGTWRLHRYGWTPGATGGSTYTDTFDHDLRMALAVFNAPVFGSREEYLTWAQSELTVTVICRDNPGGEPGRRGLGRKHTLRLVPEAGEVVSVPGANAALVRDLDAIHFMAALTPGAAPPRCMSVRKAWMSDGRLGEEDRFAPALCDRVLAAHRIGEHVRGIIAWEHGGSS